MLIHNSIRRQIALLVGCATISSVLLTLGFAAFTSLRNMRDAKVSEAKTIAGLLAHNATVALSFGQAESAESLMESLAIEPEILAAQIVAADGSVFASYGETERIPDQIPGLHLVDGMEEAHQFDRAKLTVVVPIREMGATLGRVVTVVDTSSVYHAFWQLCYRAFIVVAGMMCIAVIIGRHVLNSIVDPVTRLTQLTKEVQESEDYGLRIEVSAQNEIGFLCSRFNAMLSRIQMTNRQMNDAKDELARLNESLEQRVAERTEELGTAHKRLQEELCEKETAFAELKSLQSQMIESSHAAGMAEIANGVLHNVGNVLTSVNISAELATDHIHQFDIKILDQAATLMLEKQETMGERWVEYEGLQHLPDMLHLVSQNQNKLRGEAVLELRELRENIDVICEIVRSQQAYARQPGVKEPVRPSELFETALRLVRGNAQRLSGIQLCKEFDFDDTIMVNKHKVLQILSNFIKNGLEAMCELDSSDRKLTLSLRQTDEGDIQFQVRDTGYGIAKDIVTSLFQYGFTTKNTGHGFGLHSAACSAKEMGGEVFAESNGLGQGAVFTLQLETILPPSPAAPSLGLPVSTYAQATT